MIRNKIIKKPFNELTLTELFEIVRARFDVFVDEQHILEPEYDDVDYRSVHVFIQEGGKVIAYARVFQGESPEQWYIGRMLTVHRGQGLGAAIIDAAKVYIKKHGGKEILLHAQVQASGFYAKQGFEICSEVFDEAGIPHVMMRLAL